MHPIDRGAGLALRFLGDEGRVFRDGWGDTGLLSQLDITFVTAPAELTIEWGRPREQAGLVVTDAVFPSPLTLLPEPARTAHLRLIEPIAGADHVCLLLPAWNDEGFRTRTRLARRLALSHIGSLLLEAAFYGTRRVDGEGSPIRTVADMALLSRSIVDEARAVAVDLAGRGARVGVSGYSMGGSLAGVTAATLDIPLAVTLLAPAHSPRAVMFDGVLSRAVDWSALGAGAHDRLSAVLDLGSVLRVPPSRPTERAVIVGAKGDGFVRPETTLAIHEHWPGSELLWVNGGHASLLWTRQDVLSRAIVRGFERAGLRPAR